MILEASRSSSRENIFSRKTITTKNRFKYFDILQTNPILTAATQFDSVFLQLSKREFETVSNQCQSNSVSGQLQDGSKY